VSGFGGVDDPARGSHRMGRGTWVPVRSSCWPRSPAWRSSPPARSRSSWPA